MDSEREGRAGTVETRPKEVALVYAHLALPSQCPFSGQPEVHFSAGHLWRPPARGGPIGMGLGWSKEASWEA